jgi:hypothetical protein
MVQFYFEAKILGQDVPLAVISKYSPRNEALFQESFGTIWECQREGGYRVIPAKSIRACVAMVPDIDDPDRYVLVEKPGLEVAILGGVQEQLEE